MWHEARRQERKIRGMLVDYRRRAERRRDFYEKIKADPTQFLQVHGRQCKIHLDPSIAAAADSAVMMPWQGQSDNLIDRFDVRAHLDYIPAVKKEQETDLSQEERQLNYERYRIIAQNSFLGISEEKFLKQLHLEEQFGYTEMKGKKEARTGGAAIGFNYEEGTGVSQVFPQDDEESDDNSDSDLDVDLAINVAKMDPTQAHEMNKHGRSFGMSSNDFYSFLTNDLEEAETFRLAKEEEHEKALFSGRKSRRERRAHREKRLANRVISPPSYAAQASPTLPLFREESKSKSRSRSPSPDNTGKITYITSFGDDEETPSSSKPTYADKVKYGKSKSKREGSSDRIIYFSRRSSRSRSRERGYSKRRRKSRSRSRRRSRSRTTRSWSKSRRTRSRSRSRRRSRSRSRRRSRSRSKDRYLKSRSPSIRKESPPKVLPRYYGRKKSDQSSSDLSDSDEEDDLRGELIQFFPEGSPVIQSWVMVIIQAQQSKSKTSSSLTVIERLKRKRQALLNRQYKADKIAEQLKTEREKQEQQTREDELREMAIKLRRRQREKRHAYDSRSSSSSDSEGSVKSKSSTADKEESPEQNVETEKEVKSFAKRQDSRYDDREKRERSKERRESKDGDRDSRRDRKVSCTMENVSHYQGQLQINDMIN
ncbi:hypothetical protein NQ315_002134 [Exocentrus adspersus]|uniref:Suppressor of white apricot N-terminal domain-containing protein n=1 Tax=Exocentrus adspersus TaxID=1586481 RepID=A0AAV8VYU3_9CUCU|nr:hypothetical protein NQ315_002134 [Exocentrus adspersus]